MASSADLASCDAATSRSSAKRVAAVVNKFCDLKRKLVSDIGFGGILRMPQINKTPRKFSVWLLSKVDIPSRSIIVNGIIKVRLTDAAFHRVLGIPCGTKQLSGLDSRCVHDKVDFIKLALGSTSIDPLETCSLKVAEDVVTMTYTDGMNREQMDRFKVSFVVFVVGHFLVAKPRTNHGVDDYWGSLLQTEAIVEHNFCSMVIDEILESAKKVQQDLNSKQLTRHVTGCTLGLQVLYLDSLNLAGFALPPDVLPRISLFDLPLLKSMVNADQENNISYGKTDSGLSTSAAEHNGNKIVRYEGGPVNSIKPHLAGVAGTGFRTPQPAVSTYLTACLRGDIQQKLTNPQVHSLKWHNARMIYHVRKTKKILIESGGVTLNREGLKSLIEVHMEELMGKIFQDNLTLAQKLHKTGDTDIVHAKKPQTSITSLHVSSDSYSGFHEGQTKGCRKYYTDSGTSTSKNSDCRSMYSDIAGRRLFHDDINTSSKKIKKEQDDGSTSNGSNMNVGGSMPEPFLLSEADITSITEHGCRLEIERAKAGVVPRFKNKLKCNPKKKAPNPWEKGSSKNVVSLMVTNNLYDWLRNNNDPTLKRNWIIHALPKYIELDGYLMKDIFIKRLIFSMEAFDIALRRIIQLDRFMYGKGVKLSWRHIMESDFADLVLKDMDPLESISIINQFTMRSNSYDISECRMIIVPALLDVKWCAYYWDMEEMKVHVLDPTTGGHNCESVEDIHNLNIAKLQSSLSMVISVLFEGWTVNWAMFRTNMMKTKLPCSGRWTNGITTLLGIQEFDGHKIVEDQTEETIEDFAKLVLYEMVSLEENYGKPPTGFIESIPNGWVDNSISDDEDPAWKRHLMCDVWVWADVLTKFAEAVFDLNEMNEEELEAKILEVVPTRLA